MIIYKEPLLRVEVDDGKYVVIQDADGQTHSLRNGSHWRDLTGDKLVLCLAQRVQQLEQELAAIGAGGVESLRSSPSLPPGQIDDGSPAFLDTEEHGRSGMTLRDDFAIAAINGALSNGLADSLWCEAAAKAAYRMADAMLAERKKGGAA